MRPNPPQSGAAYCCQLRFSSRPNSCVRRAAPRGPFDLIHDARATCANSDHDYEFVAPHFYQLVLKDAAERCKQHADST